MAHTNSLQSGSFCYQDAFLLQTVQWNETKASGTLFKYVWGWFCSVCWARIGDELLDNSLKCQLSVQWGAVENGRGEIGKKKAKWKQRIQAVESKPQRKSPSTCYSLPLYNPKTEPHKHTLNHITMHRVKNNISSAQCGQIVPFTAFPGSTLQSQPEHKEKKMCCVFLDLLQHPGSDAPEEDKKKLWDHLWKWNITRPFVPLLS